MDEKFRKRNAYVHIILAQPECMCVRQCVLYKSEIQKAPYIKFLLVLLVVVVLFTFRLIFFWLAVASYSQDLNAMQNILEFVIFVQDSCLFPYRTNTFVCSKNKLRNCSTATAVSTTTTTTTINNINNNSNNHNNSKQINKCLSSFTV